MITPENLAIHELVGLNVTVEKAANPQLIGLNGSVEYETKSMLHIRTENKTRSIPKGVCVFGFEVNGTRVTLDGARIAKRPYDRTGART